MELRFVGGVYGGNIKPTPFLCLTLKMLQIQPEKDIIVEFIKNEDFKWVKFWLANIKASVSVVQNLALVKRSENNVSCYFVCSGCIDLLYILSPGNYPSFPKSISQIHWTYIKQKWVPSMLEAVDAQRWRKLHNVVDKWENFDVGVGSCPDSGPVMSKLIVNVEELLHFLSFTFFTVKRRQWYQFKIDMRIKEDSAVYLTTQCLLRGKYPQNISCSYYCIIHSQGVHRDV